MRIFENGYALLVGVGKHRDPEYSLPTTSSDVRAIERILRQPGRCAYLEHNIRVLYDESATTQAIHESLDWLKSCATADPRATIIFYYSGHGIRDELTETYFLLPHDGTNAITGITATELSAALQAIPAQRLLVLLDCCHAGGMAKDGPGGVGDSQLTKTAPGPNVLAALKQGTGRVIISSSSGKQKSYLRKDLSLSIFTFHLLEALRGAGNLPGSREIKVSNLMNYVSDKVKQSALDQHQKDQVPFLQAAAEDFPVALIRGGDGLGKGGWEDERADAQADIADATTINQASATTGNAAAGNTVAGDLTQHHHTGGIDLSGARIGSIGSLAGRDSYQGDRVKGDKTVNRGTVEITGGTVQGPVTGLNSGTITYGTPTSGTPGASGTRDSDPSAPIAPSEYRLMIECEEVLGQDQESEILVRVQGTRPGTRYRVELRASGTILSHRFEGAEAVFYITPAKPCILDLRAVLYDPDDVQIARAVRSVDVRSGAGNQPVADKGIAPPVAGINRSIVLVPDTWTIAEAQERVFASGAEWVVVRTTAPSPDWHVFPRAVALRTFDDYAADEAIVNAFALSPTTASPIARLGQPLHAMAEYSVVVDADDHVVGVTEYAQSKGVDRLPAFEAYPSLIAPERVAEQAAFEVKVGFRDVPDPNVIGGDQRLSVPDLKADERCMVAVSGEGVKFDGEVIAWLPFEIDAVAHFNAQATRSGRLIIRADYYRGSQLIGQAKRIVIAGDVDPPEAPRNAPIVFYPPEHAVDLFILLRRIDGSILEWTAVPRDEARFPRKTGLRSPRPWTEDDARQFALAITRDAVEANRVAAHSALEAFGGILSRKVPPDIWQLQAALAKAYQRPLTVILKTDEVFVPWELAMLPDPLASTNSHKPRFWVCQTRFARWLDEPEDGPVAPLPPYKARIQHITAIASDYEDGKSLKHTLKEQTMLKDDWKATPLDATMAMLEPAIFDDAAREPGHWVHFAVHGQSDIRSDLSYLLLADKQRLTPQALVGNILLQPPRFSFVFLNACQVGTPGTALGQVAGFPGMVLSSGAIGFLAPLWLADDDEAFHFATEFYAATFNGTTVGEALQTYRATYEKTATTTRLAYMYYGHPMLQVQYRPK